MLFQKGINWNDYPVHFKRGTYIQRIVVDRSFTCDEIDKLPVKHAARSNPNLVVSRIEYGKIDMPVFSTVTNKIETIFLGKSPRTDNIIEREIRYIMSRD